MLLDATDLVVRHHPTHPPVLDGVSIRAEAGDRIAVVGGNGSGKSTLARALAGLLPLERGSVSGRGAGGRMVRVGMVLQDPAAQLVAATVADEIALGAQAVVDDPARVATIVDECVARSQLDEVWHRDPARLSGGQQQRVAVAAIDACDVDVLVLDEPTALLDAPAAARFVTRVEDPGFARDRAVVWITQVADEVASCDRVLVLDAGVLAWEGSVAQYVADPGIAATFELELPAAARVAHALRARGVWPEGAPVPTTMQQLETVLGITAGAGGPVG
ncbi:MAG: ATP-binding cassette domain-containing protein [Thermoleophilia bacterium]|nr:ATP-binding cassette domain-containing protein [Thermoleophilia bacterium]